MIQQPPFVFARLRTAVILAASASFNHISRSTLTLQASKCGVRCARNSHFETEQSDQDSTASQHTWNIGRCITRGGSALCRTTRIMFSRLKSQGSA